MSEPLEELVRPLTELEKAELLTVCQVVLTPSGLLLLRRLLFHMDVVDAALAVRRESQESSETSVCTCPDLRTDGHGGLRHPDRACPIHPTVRVTPQEPSK